MKFPVSHSLKAGVAIAMIMAAPAFAGANGTDRPHVGTCDTVVRPQPSPDGHLLLEIDLSCQFRHLGRTTGLIAQDTLLGPIDANGIMQIALLSSFTYTAANGDELHSTMNGTGNIDGAPLRDLQPQIDVSNLDISAATAKASYGTRRRRP